MNQKERHVNVAKASDMYSPAELLPPNSIKSQRTRASQISTSTYLHNNYHTYYSVSEKSTIIEKR